MTCFPFSIGYISSVFLPCNGFGLNSKDHLLQASRALGIRTLLMSVDRKKLPPLWRCPKCGARLVTRNMSHSCGKFPLQALFAKSDPHVKRIFNKIARMVRSCGRVIITPQRTRIVFQVRVRFLGCIPRKSYLICNFEFTRRKRHRRFRKVTTYARLWHGHELRVHSADELDAEVVQWIRESYAVGEQRHLL
jgi:hypothetical protein